MAKDAVMEKNIKQDARPPFGCIALLLQGGGALGTYQCGVYEALYEAGIEPDWVAGISIGAINSAIIAGNAPDKRVEKLREFWEGASKLMPWDITRYEQQMAHGNITRNIWNQTYAGLALACGVPNFFKPRFPPPWCQEDGTVAATSYYDTSPLRSTLERLVDFDRINACSMNLSVGAVNVATGNFEYFDSRSDCIGLDHIMASGALPPGFPAVEIDGEFYWDGGLVSNTPLEWVFDSDRRVDTLAFQVDLWSARGILPSNIMEVATRQKEIMYSSRTRAATDRFKEAQKLRNAISKLLDELPPEMKQSDAARALVESAEHTVCNIIHLIYHTRDYEGDSKDYEFSRLSMEDHWKAGYNDTIRTLRHPEVLQRHNGRDGVFTFDVANAAHR